MQGKLIVIEGTDCSGKETQSNILLKKLQEKGYKAVKYCFPNYDSPTGKIIGGPYLGKEYICDGWFSEGASNVDSKVSSLYYAADRKYNSKTIIDSLNNGYIVLLDRYVESNFAHQGGKIQDKEKRIKMYKWLEKLEYELLELPRPDLTIFLHMPYEYSLELKKNRKEGLDQLESSKSHLIQAENAYLEIAKMYNFKIVSCIDEKKIKTVDEISSDVYNIVHSYLIKL